MWGQALLLSILKFHSFGKYQVPPPSQHLQGSVRQDSPELLSLVGRHTLCDKCLPKGGHGAVLAQRGICRVEKHNSGLLQSICRLHDKMLGDN